MSGRGGGPLFGVIVPGRPILTQFRQISNSKYEIEIAQPSSVSEIVFVLLRPDLLSVDKGVRIFF